MLELVGLPANLETVYALAAGTFGSRTPRSMTELREGYLAYLDLTQPSTLYTSNAELTFVTDGDRLKGLLDTFNLESVVDDRQYVLGALADDVHERAWRLEQADRTREAVDRLGETLPGFRALFHLVMTVVFVARAERIFGGTASNAMGALWVCPDASWQSRDLDEFLVHELAHTLVFLDERRFGHFKDRDQLPVKDTWTRSAVRGTRRPLDKSLHSILVATEVLLVRARLGDFTSPTLHPRSESLRASTLAAITDMRHEPLARRLLSDRAVELLSLCEQRLASGSASAKELSDVLLDRA